LELLILLFEALVKLGQFGLDVVLDVALLVAHNLKNFVLKSPF
jgi:hypothetical protein